MAAQICLQSSSETELISTAVVCDIRFEGVDIVIETDKTVESTTVSRGKEESM